MIHISHFSGGIGSWAATRRVADKCGVENLHLIFADTLIEDDDLYRFVLDALADLHGKAMDWCQVLPCPIRAMSARKRVLAELRDQANAFFPNLHWIAEGRTPWEIFRAVRYVGNSRIDPCSKLLKRDFIWAYVRKEFEGQEATHYFGIDWTEEHRIEGIQSRMPGVRCVAPLCEKPLLSKPQLIDLADRAGIAPPRLYAMGFSHNNCGGFCIKSGQAQFALLLKVNPALYAYHEAEEQAMMIYLGRTDCTILKCRRNMKPGDKPKPLSLKAFRERLENDPTEYDKFEWGGCGCGT